MNELRCALKTYRLTFWQTLGRFLTTGKWDRVYRDFVYLKLGDEGYEEAPFAVLVTEIGRYEWDGEEYSINRYDPKA